MIQNPQILMTMNKLSDVHFAGSATESDDSTTDDDED